jgi:hypothetical protein
MLAATGFGPMLTLAPHADGFFGWDKLVHDR